MFNRSTRSLGRTSQSRRDIATAVSCQPIAPAVLGRPLIDASRPTTATSEQEIDLLNSGRSRQVWERVKILEEAEEYSKIDFEIVLYATPVQSAFPQHQGRMPDRVTIQRQKVTVQAASRYRYNPESQFLIATSYGVTKDLYQAVSIPMGSTVHSDLRLHVALLETYANPSTR